MYVIVPDIHGDYDRLTATLRKAGFSTAGDEDWQHPLGTKAVFLGDFIDGGSENRRVITTVRAMMAKNRAYAIMGNHELNAIMYHTPCRHLKGWLRERSARNMAQHEMFLREFLANDDLDFCPPVDRSLSDVLDWFRSLPLFIEFGGFRIVHAQWDDAAIGMLLSASPSARLPDGALDGLRDVTSGIGFAVERLLKGMEIRLPENASFLDIKNVRRTEMRLKWWAQGDRTYKNLALSVPDVSHIPDTALPEEEQLFDFRHGGKPVFVGHYKMHDTPRVDGNLSAICLDFPKTPCFYHWKAGDSEIRQDRLFVV